MWIASTLKAIVHHVGFNRYMVECECRSVPRCRGWTVVLIDTWWNVNYFAAMSESVSPLVLIDTWWNVNDIILKISFPLPSFNRYMVECESISENLVKSTVWGFNRYMVECEFAIIVIWYLSAYSFNRYMVECELQNKSNNLKNSKRFNRYMVECELYSAIKDS